MIQITVQTRILVAIQAVDFRKGIDGLARVCQEQLQTDPFSGRLFVFGNRRRTALKILAYDGRGFWLCQKLYRACTKAFCASDAKLPRGVPVRAGKLA